MRIQEIDDKKYKISDNNIFILHVKNFNKKTNMWDAVEPNEIYILEEAIDSIISTNPDFFKFLVRHRKSSRIDEDFLKDYIKFSTGPKLKIKGEKNDCLLFAERLSLNNPEYDKSKSIFRVSSDKTMRRFGTSDKVNREITNYTKNYYIRTHRRHNVEVAPKIGEAFAMLPQDLPKDGETCPYHAATVMLEDSDTRITLEADAGFKKRDTPVFDMYSVKEDKYTFYAEHFLNYTQKDLENKGKLGVKLPLTLHLIPDTSNIEEKLKKEKVTIPVKTSDRVTRNAKTGEGKKKKQKTKNKKEKKKKRSIKKKI